LLKLFEETKKFHPNYAHKSMTKERLFHQISLEGKYSEDRMTNICRKAI